MLIVNSKYYAYYISTEQSTSYFIVSIAKLQTKTRNFLTDKPIYISSLELGIQFPNSFNALVKDRVNAFCQEAHLSENINNKIVQYITVKYIQKLGV